MEITKKGKTHHYTSKTLTYAETLQKWQFDADFRGKFLKLLQDSPHQAYYWETPPVTTETVNRPFEFVLIDAPYFTRFKPQPTAFKQYYAAAENGIAAFPNLRKDALMIVPTPEAENETYTHFANFVRKAPQSQAHALFRRIGQEMEAGLNEKPIWLSTHGTGVYWLHVRLDSYPKYYHHKEYR